MSVPNPFIGEFNAKSEDQNKCDKTLYERTKIDALTVQLGLQKKGQLPNEWKKAKQFPSIKRIIRKCQETNDLFHYFQYIEKYFEA